MKRKDKTAIGIIILILILLPLIVADNDVPVFTNNDCSCTVLGLTATRTEGGVFALHLRGVVCRRQVCHVGRN